MIINRQLSLSQQKKGRHQLLLFSFMNGIALTFITGNVLSLYLLKIGFSASLVAGIISLGYAGTLFALAGKWLITKVGVSSSIRVSWIFCGILAMLLSIIPFAYNKHFVTDIEIFLIGTVLFIFYAFKSIGNSAVPPLMDEFADENNQEKFNSKLLLLFNIATIIAILIAVFLHLGFRTSLLYQILIFSGGIIIIISSFICSKMQESPVPMESAKSIKTDKLLSLIWNNKKYRSFLIFQSLVRAMILVIIPISILALKTTYKVSDETALLFALIQLLGGFATIYFYGIISDISGPKPLILINIIGLFVICILWLYAPDTFTWGYCVVIFLIGGSCFFGLDSSLKHYYITIIPRKDIVGVSLWFTTIKGAVAGTIGILLGGGLIKFYSMVAIHHNHIFKYYYLSMVILLLPVLYYACSLKSSSTDDWSIKDVLKLFLAPLKIYSYYSINSQTKYSSLSDELDNVNQLMGMSADVSEDSLIYYMKSPDCMIRTTALYSMYNLQLKEETKIAIFNCIKEYTAIHAFVGSLVLAKNNFAPALPYFRKGLLTKDDPRVWYSVMALTIMKDEKSYKKIIQIFTEAENQNLIYYCSIAIGTMRDKNNLYYLLDKLSSSIFLKKDVINSIVDAIVKVISCDVIFYRFIRLFNHDYVKGISGLIDYIDCSRVPGLHVSPKTFISNYSKVMDETKRKNMMINYLKSAFELDTPEMKELRIFKHYFTIIKRNQIRERLAIALFIKIFCKDEATDDVDAYKGNTINDLLRSGAHEEVSLLSKKVQQNSAYIEPSQESVNKPNLIQSTIEKPTKLIAAIIFLCLSYFLHALNRSIDLNNIPDIKHYVIVNIIVMGLVCVIWMTYLISKGKNWSRFFLLIYFIFLIPRVVYNTFNYVIYEHITYAHLCVQVLFLVVGFILLFSKESSLWFKKIKIENNNTHSVCWNYKVSSIFFYLSYSIVVYSAFFISRGTNVPFFDSISHYKFNYITFIYQNVVMALVLNILIIQSIRNGSKLAGVIYFVLIVIAVYAKHYCLLLGFASDPLFINWIMRVSLQIVAFIILFQKDIYRLFNFILNKKPNS